MKIVTIIGARPQFIKASAVSRAIDSFNQHNNAEIKELVIHTGQHYDKNMSDVFFDELEMRKPNYNLGISQCGHSEMTGKMLISIEPILNKEKPDFVMVYGDTNSTLAGALAGAKLNIPVIHIEAGLRSFNKKMPEEINRIVTDRVSQLLFCPTNAAVNNLKSEGINEHVYNVGDVMYDVTLYYAKKAARSIDLRKWGVKENEYTLVTVHRAENTDNLNRLKDIVAAVCQIAEKQTVLFPVHPRTRKLLECMNMLPTVENLKITEPVSYFEMLSLESSANCILTDSGGVQKEAFFHQVPCITLRDETEWVETVELGANKLCGHNIRKIVDASIGVEKLDISEKPYGIGDASEKIVNHIHSYN